MNRVQRASLLCISLLLIVSGCSPKDNDLTLAVSPEEPAPSIARNLATALQSIDVTVEIASVDEQTEIIEKIRRREVDLAIIEEPGQPLQDVVTLTPLYPSVLHILNGRSDSPAEFSDLIRGASIYAGRPGGSAQRLLVQLAIDFDVGPGEYHLLDNPWSQRPDVYFIIGGLLSRENVKNFADYRLFSFAAKDDLPGGSVADGIVLRHHYARPFLLPKGIYPTLADDAVLTLSIRSVLVAHKSLDEELAYDIARSLFGQSQETAQIYPLATLELNESVQSSDLMMPLHNGTRRYLERDRPGFVERNVDVLALYFTIFITLLTGIVALIRHRSQLRKDRVDNYYTRLLEIRKKMKETANETLAAACYQEVLDVQREVLELLVDERIAADASLVAFVSLSNQMISELRIR